MVTLFFTGVLKRKRRSFFRIIFYRFFIRRKFQFRFARRCRQSDLYINAFLSSVDVQRCCINSGTAVSNDDQRFFQLDDFPWSSFVSGFTLPQFFSSNFSKFRFSNLLSDHLSGAKFKKSCAKRRKFGWQCSEKTQTIERC